MVNFPINVAIGGLSIPAHLLLYITAFFVAFRYYEILRKNGDFISNETRWSIIIGCAIGALLGSRILAALETPSLFFNPPSLIFYYEGQTIVGGLIGGLIGVELTKKIIGEKRSTGDLFTFPIILGMVIGRIGCLLTGVSDRTVGVPSNFILAFDQGDGILRHPTSLYEIIFLLCLWSILLLISRNYKLKNGNLFNLFMFAYLLFRFMIEFIKPINSLFLGLSAIQLVSLFGAVYFSARIYKKGLIKNG